MSSYENDKACIAYVLLLILINTFTLIECYVTKNIHTILVYDIIKHACEHRLPTSSILIMNDKVLVNQISIMADASSWSFFDTIENSYILFGIFTLNFIFD